MSERTSPPRGPRIDGGSVPDIAFPERTTTDEHCEQLSKKCGSSKPLFDSNSVAFVFVIVSGNIPVKKLSDKSIRAIADQFVSQSGGTLPSRKFEASTIFTSAVIDDHDGGNTPPSSLDEPSTAASFVIADHDAGSVPLILLPEKSNPTISVSADHDEGRLPTSWFTGAKKP